MVDYRPDASISPNICVPDRQQWSARPFHSRFSETGIVDVWLNKG